MNTSKILGKLTYGFSLIESNNLTEQRRFPRTKKRRIRNKWAKRLENHGGMKSVIVDEQRRVIYAHPTTAQKLKLALNPKP